MGIGSLAQGYDFDFSWLADAWPTFLRAAWLSVQILTGSAVLAILFGLIAGQVLTSSRFWVRLPARLYVDFFRLTPIIMQIVLVFFLLPILTDIRIRPVTAGIIALSLNYGAFFAEIFRAGVTSLDRGQREAALAMGMGRFTALRRVIYPQAVRRMLPPLGSMLVGLTKDTSLLTIIGVSELFNTAQSVGARTFRQLEVLMVISVMYLIMNLPFAILAERLHRRFVAQS